MSLNRISWPVTAFAAVLAAMLVSPASAQESSEERKEPTVEEQLKVLTDEVSRLREQMNLPETDRELRSVYGLGPAASKVYGVSQGVSLGGYGEFYLAAPVTNTDDTGAVRYADMYRFIGYVGYKFSDRIIMNTEIEYEHATTSGNYQGKGGSVSVEFSYLDFLVDPAFNVRAGLVLVPMGFVNVMHEPTTYRGNIRPATERAIIPATWRELGAGVHGGAGALTYSAYLVSGMNAKKFDGNGAREGRQSGNQIIWEDLGGVAGADYAIGAGDGTLTVGASAYFGGSDQGLVTDSTGAAIAVENQVYEAHAQFRKGGLGVRALVATSRIDNAEALSRALYTDENNVLTKQVPESQLGWYAEAGYDVAPHLFNAPSFTLTPWVRYERYNLQDGVAAGTGIPANPAADVTLVTAGLESRPHPNVVIKLDFVFPSNEADAVLSDEIRLGAGFIY
jgi:hypothetical protein